MIEGGKMGRTRIPRATRTQGLGKRSCRVTFGVTVGGGFAWGGKPGIPRGGEPVSLAVCPVVAGKTIEMKKESRRVEAEAGRGEREREDEAVSPAIGIPPINLHRSWSA